MSSERGEPERYEPLPGLAELPAWLWRRSSRRVRIGVALAALVAIGAAVALAPSIRETKEERDAAERRERAERRAQRIYRS